jgi:hypothetical protein
MVLPIHCKVWLKIFPVRVIDGTGRSFRLDWHSWWRSCRRAFGRACVTAPQTLEGRIAGRGCLHRYRRRGQIMAAVMAAQFEYR